MIVPLKVFIDVNSTQLARFNTFYFITTDCDVRIILVKVMYSGHLRGGEDHNLGFVVVKGEGTLLRPDT